MNAAGKMPTPHFPCCGEGAVVLADVDAVGIDFCGEGRVVVEDEGDPSGAAKGEDFFRDAADGGEVVPLGAELEKVRTASEKGLGNGLGEGLGDVAEIEDAVEKRVES